MLICVAFAVIGLVGADLVHSGILDGAQPIGLISLLRDLAAAAAAALLLSMPLGFAPGWGRRPAGGGAPWRGHFHDPSERRQAEIILARANRMLRARSLTNLALVDADDEISYLDRACRIIVEVCGHTMIWIGYAEEGPDQRVRPAASAGFEHGYLEAATITWGPNERGQGPTGSAIRTRTPQICQDMLGDPRLGPWHDEAIRCGYRSSVALPLIAGGKVLGALTLYSSERGAFPGDEVELLGEVAGDIAYGISVLRLRATHAHTERSLAESQHQLRLALDSAAMGVWTSNPLTGEGSADPRARKLLGLPPEAEMSHDLALAAVCPEDRDRVVAAFARSVEEGVPFSVDVRIVHPDASRHWVSVRGQWQHEAEGKAGRMFGVVHDITPSKEAEAELRKLSLAVDQSPNSIMITGLDGRIEYVNEAFCRVTGYSREEARGCRPSFLAAGRTPPETYRQLRAALDRGEAWSGEFHNRRKSGELCVEQAWISPVRQKDGRITHYLSIQEDITEKIRSEQELARYRLHLEDLVVDRTRQLQDSSRLAEERATEIADLYNNAPCGYHSLDPSGLFVQINDTELSWLGYRRDEVVGKMHFADLLAAGDLDRFAVNFKQFLVQGSAYDIEYDLRGKDGRTIPVVLSATLIRDGAGRALKSRVVAYNLTEIKEARKAASRHAELAETFFQHSVACLAILDRNYNYLRVNGAFARASRREIGDFIGRNHRELYPADYAGTFDRVIRTKRPAEGAASPYRFPDQPDRGTTFWDWTLVPVLDRDGEVDYLVFSLHDVTTRKQAEEAVRESEAKYRALFDLSPDGILLFDPTTARPIDFNAAAHRALGYSREEFAALSISDFDILENPHEIVEHCQAIIGSGGEHFETLHRTRDGEIRNKSIIVQPIMLQGRRLFHSIWRDITEIHHARQAVEENERRLREITATLGEALIVADEAGRIRLYNPAAGRLLGWSETEVMGQSAHWLMHARHPDGSPFPEEACPLYRAYRSSDALINHEDVFWTRDGRPLPVSVTLTTILRDGRSAGVVIAFQDISPRKQTEAELRRYRHGLEALVEERTAALSESNRELALARDRAETANLAKSTFLANMSHELRTPLSAILGFSQLLEMNPNAELSDTHRLCVDHILRSGRHLLALINDLLDLAKVDAGQVVVVPERIVVAELLSGLDASLEALAEAADIAVTIRSGDGLTAIWADKTRLNQVLLNLGSNAIKYNRPDGRVDITCEQSSPQWLRLSVSDTGSGIPETRQADLFTPFNRLGRETGTIEGTGIGLALSRKLVHLMGGQIGFSSRPGDGSRFWVDIPAYRPPADGDTAGPEEAPVPPGHDTARVPGTDHTVLYVDDNAGARDLLATIIANSPETGLRVLTVGTAEEGVAVARRCRPDLILMDINLPGMNGFAALAELRRRKETREIPVFALSTSAAAADIERGLAAGFDRYLTKPFIVRDLMAVINEKLAPLAGP